MNSEQRKHLETLRDFLRDKVPEAKFDMNTWAYINRAATEEPSFNFEEVKLEACGTAGCAIGWATTIPSIREAGLRLEWDGYSVFPAYKDTGYFVACADFFGITYEDAEYLFDPAEYSGHVPKDVVVERITTFLLSHK